MCFLHGSVLVSSLWLNCFNSFIPHARIHSQKQSFEFWHLLEQVRGKIKRPEAKSGLIWRVPSVLRQSCDHRTANFCTNKQAHHFTCRSIPKVSKCQPRYSCFQFLLLRRVRKDFWVYRTHSYKQLFITRTKHIWPGVIKAGSMWSFLVLFLWSLVLCKSELCRWYVILI